MQFVKLTMVFMGRSVPQHYTRPEGWDGYRRATSPPSHQLLGLADPAPDLTGSNHQSAETAKGSEQGVGLGADPPGCLGAVVQACQGEGTVSPCFSSYISYSSWKQLPR